MDFMSGVAITKQIYELLKIIKDGRDQALVSEAAGNLSEKITALQMLNAELSGLYHSEREKAMQLSKEKAEIEMFISNADHYELHKTPAGSVAYRPKPATDNEVAPYYVCAHCYQKAIISILQPTNNDASFHMIYCPECKNKYRLSRVPPMKPISAHF